MSKLTKSSNLQRAGTMAAIVMVLGLFMAAFPAAAFADTPAPVAPVKKIVDRHDVPVASGAARRTWTWGIYFSADNEPYKESPGGQRQVYYYDKGRLEITNPNADQNNEYYATSGLLLKEMITGQVQLGDSAFEQREPAQVVLAGDNPPLLDTAPTYADLQELVSFDGSWKSGDLTGQVAGLYLVRGGTVDSNFTKFSNVKYAQYDSATGHNIADVFLKFMNSSGLIYDGSKVVNGPLYNPLFVFGHAISEPYWSQVTVAGNKRYVLMQAFERRLLTYTPENSPEFQVELGNIGRAYYQWRYGQAGPAPALDPAYTQPTMTPALQFYNDTSKNLNNVKSVQYSQYTNLAQIVNIKYEAPNKRYLLEKYAPCGANGYYAEIWVETRIFFNCLVNNKPTGPWTYVDEPTPFRWPAYSGIDLNDLSENFSFGPDTNIGNEPVRNIITTTQDMDGFNVSTIIGISKNSGLPLEGSSTYEADGKSQVFNVKYDSYNQAFNIQAPAGAVPYDSSDNSAMARFQGVHSDFFGEMAKANSAVALPQAVPGEIIVKLKDTPGAFQSRLSQWEGFVGWESGANQFNGAANPQLGLLKVKAGATETTLARLQADPQVEYAEPNYLYSYASIKEPNDAQYVDQWYLKAIKAPRAWSISTGQFINGAGLDQVKVAVVDSGVHVDHPDLKQSIAGSFDVFDGISPNDDPVGHGTMVAGVISAQGNNGVYGAGLNWRTKLLSYRTGDRRGITCKAVSDAVKAATDAGARVINLSLGGYQKCQTQTDAIAYAVSKGVVVVAAAGNESTDAPSYPASLPGVISVAATGRLGTPASFSNYGKTVTLAAPGVNICSTTATGRFGCAAGTSFSAPIVSGVVSLMLAVNPGLTPQQVKAILIATATPAPGKAPGEFDERYGYGTVNAYAAVRAAATNQLPK